MNTKQRFGLAVGFVVLSVIVSLVASPSLPDHIVSNWDAGGSPNGTMPQFLGLWLFPSLTAGLIVVFAIIPRIDPLRENIASFRGYYDWFVVIFAAYMFALHAGILLFNLGYAFDFVNLVFVAAAGLLYYAGVLVANAERNWFVGIRTPWTLSSETVWRRTHDIGSTLFKITAVLTLVGLLFGEYAIYFLVVPALVTTAVTVAYSYYLYERIERGSDPSSDPGSGR